MEAPSFYSYFFPSTHLFPYHFIPQNHVHWTTETPDSYIYSAQIPAGTRKDEIILEVEDSKYLIIRTDSSMAAESFNRRLRLPRQVDIDRISAQYVDGVFTVTVPRSFVRDGAFLIDPADKTRQANVLARAA